MNADTLQVSCDCGARYRAARPLAGRSLKCKHCGGSIQVPADTSRLPELAALMTGAAVAPEPTLAEAPASQGPATPVRIIGDLKRSDRSLPEGESSARTFRVGGVNAYLAAVGRSAITLLSPLNLIMLGMVALALSLTIVLNYSARLGLAGSIILYAYFAAFMLNVVQDAAGGEEDLTQPDLGEGVWDSLIYPAILFGASKLLVLLPAIGFAVYRIWTGHWQSSEYSLFQTWDFVRASAPSQELAFLIALYVLGLFLWPMTLLVVAVGASLPACSGWI